MNDTGFTVEVDRLGWFRWRARANWPIPPTETLTGRPGIYRITAWGRTEAHALRRLSRLLHSGT